ncbi:MAG: 5-formyltetrahydrofolate cyclo-ligase [Bdellovibrionales bacterium]|nr:5-formyltetrahydrofolate cyclo-ligase [Bdellovibrionales bacterium]
MSQVIHLKKKVHFSNKSSKMKLRGAFREKIQQHDKKENCNQQADRQLSEILSRLDIWENGLTVASYYALPGEISPSVFQQKYHQKLKFVFPQMREGKHSFVSAVLDKGEDWEKSPWGGWQPSGAKQVSLSEIDVCFVPALAFDREGRRLGRGKGFYDRILSQFTGLKLGLAHVFQICNSTLPEESHDIRVDAVLTSHFMFVLSDRWSLFNVKKKVKV